MDESEDGLFWLSDEAWAAIQPNLPYVDPARQGLTTGA